MISEDKRYRVKNILNYIFDAYLGKSEKKTIKLGSCSRAESLYTGFSKRSVKFLGVKRLTIAVAILDVSKYANFEAYRLTIRGKNSADYYKRRCEKKGYLFMPIDMNDYIDEIFAINTSLDKRCGKDMSDAYRKKETSYDSNNTIAYGVFKEDHLIAYTQVSVYADLLKINRILGHGDYLRDNIMYFLLFMTIQESFALKDSGLKYFMYDSFWGNPKGLVLFKNRFKFVANKVNWKLK